MDVKQHDETGAAIVPVLACVLGQLCSRNDRLILHNRSISKFHALRPPNISIREYLSRISKYALCSGECFVLSLVYVDRIIQGNPNFIVNSLNIHRLLITSVMLAAKFFDDQYFNNAYYAKVGGVPCTEMNSLEVEFLFMTNFTLFVSTDTYKQYYEELWNHANSNSTCGCNRAKVPPLVLPFEEEEKKRKIQRERMLLIQQQGGEPTFPLFPDEDDEQNKNPLTLPPITPISSRKGDSIMEDQATETPTGDSAEDNDVEETPGGGEDESGDGPVEIEEDGDFDETEDEVVEPKRPVTQHRDKRPHHSPEKKSALPVGAPTLTHSISWGKLAQAKQQQQIQQQQQQQQIQYSYSNPSLTDTAMTDSPVTKPVNHPPLLSSASATYSRPTNETASSQQSLHRQPLTYRAVTYPQTISSSKQQPAPSSKPRIPTATGRSQQPTSSSSRARPESTSRYVPTPKHASGSHYHPSSRDQLQTSRLHLYSSQPIPTTSSHHHSRHGGGGGFVSQEQYDDEDSSMNVIGGSPTIGVT